ncbi:MAG: ABC transporter permease [Acholeplasmatales bacterium]|nr:ABC transporter permease [Acholeplasmatales bacterium]
MLFKKLLRTTLQYKAQFISMIIMIAIGIGVFVGFNMEWHSLEKNTNSYFEETAFADYRIYSEKGFSETDINKIKEIEGIEEANRILAVDVENINNSDALSLNVLEEYTVSKFHLVKGLEYNQNSEGFWLSDKYAEANDIKLNDELTISYKGFVITGNVIGLIKASEHMVCVADDNQVMPNYESYGYVYTNPNMIFNKLGFELYTQINIISSLEKSEIEKKISDELDMTLLVLSKDENVSYVGATSEVSEGKTMGSILPVLFLAIGFLTMITTMHRVTSNEKIQIGTLKAIGFKNRKILLHYTTFGLFIGLLGSILGIGIGFIIAKIIIAPNGMMSTFIDMPTWDLTMPWWCIIIIIITLLALTLISALSVRKMLKGSAAESLRPYTPKKMKNILLEKTKLWNKLSFSNRWNIRDIFRNKMRSIMTLIGVLGCTILLVGGLGMKDTMDSFVSLIDDELYNYNTRININEAANNIDAINLSNQYNGDWASSSSISLNGETISLEIYNINNDTIRFIDEDDNRVKLSNDGAYVCLRLLEKYKIGDVITISPYGNDKTYEIRIAGALRSVMSENIVMTDEYAESINYEYKITSIYTNYKLDEIADNNIIDSKQTKASVVDSYNSFLDIMNVMVLLLVAAAIVLGVVVLYNLGVMNYTERYKELSTLKVVGFNDKQVGKILISQNIWLTIIGIILVLPFGYLVLRILISTLGKDMELKLTLGVPTYIISLLVTLGVSLFVSFLIAKKNKKIDMVEALKRRD